MARWVLHVDMDEFIAAVEVLRHPELRGMPVVVGGDGDPTKRGVVSTASYEARGFGVHSAMPLRTALKRCPEAVFLPVDADHYLEASDSVMETLRSFPAVVQVLGWDEAFMGVETDDPERLARAVQRAVLDRTALWCSIGIGDSRHRAKLASAFAKPRGVARLTREEWASVMGSRPVDALWGIGKKTAGRLRAIGIETVDQLAAANEDVLVTAFGPSTGPWLRQLGTGEDDAVVSAEPHVPRGRAREQTFQRDLTDPLAVRREVERLARELAGDIPAGRAVTRATVKIRFAPFFTATHAAKLPSPTVDPDAIAAGAFRAFDRFEVDRPVRLVGVRVEFTDPPDVDRTPAPGGAGVRA